MGYDYGEPHMIQHIHVAQTLLETFFYQVETGSSTGTIIATVGAHQSTFGTGTNDSYLVKFNSVGVRQWGTYYGGSGIDLGLSCCTDGLGNAYLAGHTSSSASIATSGAHQTTYAAANDAFLVKFDVNGVVQWGTYYGGTGSEQGNSCSTDAIGNIYLAGTTTSNSGTIIATTGSHLEEFLGVVVLMLFQ